MNPVRPKKPFPVMIFLIFFLMPTLIQSRIMDDGRVDDSTLSHSQDQGIRMLHVGPHAPVAPPKKKQPKTAAPSSVPSYVPTTMELPPQGMSKTSTPLNPSDAPTSYPSDAPVSTPSAAPSDSPSDVHSSVPSFFAAGILDPSNKGKGGGGKGSMMK